MAGYARREGIAASALQYWARKLKAGSGTELVRVVPGAAAGPLVLEVGGVRVVVGPDFDRDLLARVLDVLVARATT